MSKAEALFRKIINEFPEAIEGKMFGAACIKSANGKVVAIFWKDALIFKLDENSQKEALKLEGANIGSHLYAPEKPMKGWISIPFLQTDTWKYFTERAIQENR